MDSSSTDKVGVRFDGALGTPGTVHARIVILDDRHQLDVFERGDVVEQRLPSNSLPALSRQSNYVAQDLTNVAENMAEKW